MIPAKLRLRLEGTFFTNELPVVRMCLDATEAAGKTEASDSSLTIKVPLLKFGQKKIKQRGNKSEIGC